MSESKVLNAVHQKTINLKSRYSPNLKVFLVLYARAIK